MIELAEIGRAIEARERLDGIMDGMAAAGTMEKRDRRAFMRSLEEAANTSPTEPEAPIVKIDPAEAAAQLAAWGIGFGPE